MMNNKLIEFIHICLLQFYRSNFIFLNSDKQTASTGVNTPCSEEQTKRVASPRNQLKTECMNLLKAPWSSRRWRFCCLTTKYGSLAQHAIMPGDHC